ncbi:MAG: PDZ domain-containing protein [Verrucomicrobia bacterium]|nr:PDZ domain-containing protein [Verrucomicrobiota bacterium]
MHTKTFALIPLLVFLGLTGCTTTYDKPGATDDDFQRDLMLAEGYAASQIQNATVMPAQNGLEALGRGIAVPMMKRRMINDQMKKLGWEKQSKGKRVSEPMYDPTPSSNGTGGLGAIIDPRPYGLLVLNVAVDGPASKFGLRPGDTITEIDGVQTAGISLEQALDKLRGAVGTSISLTLCRAGGATKQVKVIREDTSRLRYSK